MRRCARPWKTLHRPNEINPHVDQWDEWEAAEIFPAHELFKKMGDAGPPRCLTKPVEYRRHRDSTISYSHGHVPNRSGW